MHLQTAALCFPFPLPLWRLLLLNYYTPHASEPPNLWLCFLMTRDASSRSIYPKRPFTTEKLSSQQPPSHPSRQPSPRSPPAASLTALCPAPASRSYHLAGRGSEPESSRQPSRVTTAQPRLAEEPEDLPTSAVAH